MSEKTTKQATAAPQPATTQSTCNQFTWHCSTQKIYLAPKGNTKKQPGDLPTLDWPTPQACTASNGCRSSFADSYTLLACAEYVLESITTYQQKKHDAATNTGYSIQPPAAMYMPLFCCDEAGTNSPLRVGSLCATNFRLTTLSVFPYFGPALCLSRLPPDAANCCTCFVNFRVVSKPHNRSATVSTRGSSFTRIVPRVYAPVLKSAGTRYFFLSMSGMSLRSAFSQITCRQRH